MTSPVVKLVASGIKWTPVRKCIPSDKTVNMPLDDMQSCNEGYCFRPLGHGRALLGEDGHVTVVGGPLERSSWTLRGRTVRLFIEKSCIAGLLQREL